jgi:hypothetical protein
MKTSNRTKKFFTIFSKDNYKNANKTEAGLLLE